jgi:hypothetical protein
MTGYLRAGRSGHGRKRRRRQLGEFASEPLLRGRYRFSTSSFCDRRLEHSCTAGKTNSTKVGDFLPGSSAIIPRPGLSCPLLRVFHFLPSCLLLVISAHGDGGFDARAGPAVGRVCAQGVRAAIVSICFARTCGWTLLTRLRLLFVCCQAVEYLVDLFNDDVDGTFQDCLGIFSLNIVGFLAEVRRNAIRSVSQLGPRYDRSALLLLLSH